MQIYHGDRDSELFIREAKFQVPASEQMVDSLAAFPTRYVNSFIVLKDSGVSLDKGFYKPHKFVNA